MTPDEYKAAVRACRVIRHRAAYWPMTRHGLGRMRTRIETAYVVREDGDTLTLVTEAQLADTIWVRGVARQSTPDKLMGLERIERSEVLDNTPST